MVKVYVIEGLKHGKYFGNISGFGEEYRRVYYLPATLKTETTPTTPEALVYERPSSGSYWFSLNAEEIENMFEIIEKQRPSLVEITQIEITEEAIKKLVLSGKNKIEADTQFNKYIKDFLPVVSFKQKS